MKCEICEQEVNTLIGTGEVTEDSTEEEEAPWVCSNCLANLAEVRNLKLEEGKS